MKNFVLCMLSTLFAGEVVASEAGTIKVYPTHKLLKSGEIVPIETKSIKPLRDSDDNDDNEH